MRTKKLLTYVGIASVAAPVAFAATLALSKGDPEAPVGAKIKQLMSDAMMMAGLEELMGSTGEEKRAAPPVDRGPGKSRNLADLIAPDVGQIQLAALDFGGGEMPGGAAGGPLVTTDGVAGGGADVASARGGAGGGGASAVSSNAVAGGVPSNANRPGGGAPSARAGAAGGGGWPGSNEDALNALAPDELGVPNWGAERPSELLSLLEDTEFPPENAAPHGLPTGPQLALKPAAAPVLAMPIPSSVWMLLAATAGLIFLGRRRLSD